MTTQENTSRDGRKQAAGGRRSRTLQTKPLGGYVRVSRQGEREDDKFRSPDFQAEELERWANAHGRRVRMYDAEIDVSGSRAKRPILEELVSAIERGELGGIVVAKLDRLSRLRPVDRVRLFERIEAAGGEIHSASENLDPSTPEGRFAREVFLAVARMEWERKAEGFARAKTAAIERGAKISSVANFGYRFGEGHRLEPVAGEREILVELFELRASGASRGDVLELFERRTGRSSYEQTIAYMLRNRVYHGEARYGRELELVNADAHEPLISEVLFERVQAINRARSTGSGSGGKARSLLAGIARCACCGRGLISSATGNARRRSYKCPNPARKCAGRASIGEDALDAYVTAEVLAWAGEAADELVELELELEASTPRIVLEHRLGEARASLIAYEADVERELRIGRDAYEAGSRTRAELVERLELELEAAGEASAIEIARTTIRRELEAGTLTVDERRRLFAVVLESVEVRRTPRRNAPGLERAAVVFASAAAGALAVAEDAAKLLDQLPA